LRLGENNQARGGTNLPEARLRAGEKGKSNGFILGKLS